MNGRVVGLLTRQVAAAFRSYGKEGRSNSFIGQALADTETSFAAGVPVRDVVEFTLRAAANIAPEHVDAVDPRRVADDLHALDLEMRRFEDAMCVVVALRVSGRHTPGSDPNAEALNWVIQAAVTEGMRTIRRAITSTLRELIVLRWDEVPSPELPLDKLLDIASGSGRRQGFLSGEAVFDLRVLGAPPPERTGKDLRFPSMPSDRMADDLLGAARRYARDAKRALADIVQDAARAGKVA